MAVYVADGAFAAGEVGRGDEVIAALVDGESAAVRRIGIVIVVLVEAVPPIEVIFGKVGLAGFTGIGPDVGDEQIAFDRGHGAVGPAGAAVLILYGGDVVFAIDVSEIVGGGRGGQGNGGERQTYPGGN